LSDDNRELERLKEVAGRTSILTPEKQRALWAKVITTKSLMIRKGICSAAEFNELEAKVRQSLDEQVLNKVKKDLGADEEPS
jgi:hypothetical protein